MRHEQHTQKNTQNRVIQGDNTLDLHHYHWPLQSQACGLSTTKHFRSPDENKCPSAADVASILYKRWWLNSGVERYKSCKNAAVCEVSWGGPTAVEQLEEMLDQRHQEKEGWDYLVMDLIILGHCLVNGKKERKILVVFGLTAHHLQNIRHQKWLHMEECRFSD